MEHFLNNDSADESNELPEDLLEQIKLLDLCFWPYENPEKCCDCKDVFVDEKNNRRSNRMPFLCEACAEYRTAFY